MREHLTSIQKILGSIPSWVPFFGGFLYSVSEAYHLKEFAMDLYSLP